jgi:DNA recombination protein RmuC
MHTIFLNIILAGLFVLGISASLIAMFLTLRRLPRTADVSIQLQNISQVMQQNQTQTGILSEKLSHLEPVNQAVTNVHLELRGLAERVSEVERNQTQVGDYVIGLGTSMAQADTAAKIIADTTAAIRQEISHAKTGLAELQAQATARQEVEQSTAESIKRLEAIIAGTQTKGAAGENILEHVFARLPAEWQVRNFRVGNKQVEFGLRLPNSLILPIDSKWTGTTLLEQLVGTNDANEQRRLKKQIQDTVLQKAQDVKKYVDPALTVNFGVIAVPDAIYDLCGAIQADIFGLNVALISYSMFIPYLLVVFQMMLKNSQCIDIQKLDWFLQNAQSSVKALQDELEGRFARAVTMLMNSRDEMSQHLGKITSSLVTLRIGNGSPSVPVLAGSAGGANNLAADDFQKVAHESS